MTDTVGFIQKLPPTVVAAFRATLEELSEADVLELRDIVEEHQQRTASPVAADVLRRWEQLLERGAFVKVMPHDYKRVLREREEEEALAARAAGNGALTSARPLDAVGEAQFFQDAFYGMALLG